MRGAKILIAISMIILWAELWASEIMPKPLHNRIVQGSAPLILDVRTQQEFSTGHVPGAKNIPLDQLQRRWREMSLSQDQELVVYCERGVRAKFAEDILTAAGFTNLLHLKGHMQAWRAAQLPQQH